jgi:hypothetical protein
LASAEDGTLDPRPTLDIWQTQHPERVEEPEPAREDRNEQGDLQGKVGGVAVDFEDHLPDGEASISSSCVLLTTWASCSSVSAI